MRYRKRKRMRRIHRLRSLHDKWRRRKLIRDAMQKIVGAVIRSQEISGAIGQQLHGKMKPGMLTYDEPQPTIRNDRHPELIVNKDATEKIRRNMEYHSNVTKMSGDEILKAINGMANIRRNEPSFSYQGRTVRQYSFSMTMATIAAIALVITIILLIATT